MTTPGRRPATQGGVELTGSAKPGALPLRSRPSQIRGMAHRWLSVDELSVRDREEACAVMRAVQGSDANGDTLLAVHRVLDQVRERARRIAARAIIKRGTSARRRLPQS